MFQNYLTEHEAVINRNFILQLEKDITQYDILYIFAPLGWGKTAYISEFCKKINKNELVLIDDADEICVENGNEQRAKTGRRIYVIPELEKLIGEKQQKKLFQLMSGKRKNDIFLFASSIAFPEELLPYTISNRCIIYRSEDIRPTMEDVAVYMKTRGISLTKEELLRIEKDCDNLPLFIQMLGNLLCSSHKGYSRVLREQCFEDVFMYIDVVFFRTFTEEDQNALLKMSCFEYVDSKLISYMLEIPRSQAEAFIERLLYKSSVLEKSNNGWKFQPLMKQFLNRAIQKYLDCEERLNDYRKAMDYLVRQENWNEALRFAYILQDQEELAFCLNKLLMQRMDYGIFVSLEDYFRELSVEHLKQYPGLLIAGSILKSITGDMDTSRWYERLYLQAMDAVEDEEICLKMKSQLLFLYVTRPGTMQDGFSKKSIEVLASVDDSVLNIQNPKFEPHYISLLRGEKDYCHCFRKSKEMEDSMKKYYAIVDKFSDRAFSIMLKFMETEVLYERNELDQALNELVKISKEAKIAGAQRMQQMCILAMVDLLAARNQLNSMETFQLEKLEANNSDDMLFGENCQAHAVYYNLLKNNELPVLTWMKENSPDEHERFLATQYYQYLIKAKVYIWMEQYVRARMILRVLMDFAVEYRMAYLEAQVRILEAVIYYREGGSLWKDTLIPALEWGKELGFIRIFADEGAAVYELLNRIAQEEKNWEKNDYLKKVLSAAKAHMLQYPRYLKPEKQGVIEEFSNSEQSVMRLLVLGEKNAEIAGRLCISENTVKYHLKNIYQKLQVKNRSQAIAKIRELKIL